MILVVGCARSGTSMTCAVLEACGASFGETMGPGPGNPGGFYENKALREGLLKPTLRRLGCDPTGRLSLPETRSLPRLHGWREAVISRLGPDVCAYKDAKVLLLWPIWAEAFPEARWLIVRRPRLAILDSIRRATWMQLGPAERRAFVDAYLARICELKCADVTWQEVWPDPARPGAFRDAVAFCGLTWRAEAVRMALRPEWWHEQPQAHQ